ncbi:TAF5 [Cyberlindnera jadinii]|uniref:TAF5 protein n=1 Tax=Cyberlindnera jadinii (strain ATCC 18201 / CBS 1600 / BCRC 20928 / JCM 3617 / NBRC 0987 / NRRL Y-1542) TaxID=983966 RepID=A0A0H5C1E9_CYBJN|nr:WD40 repeat-like protein [Cyberlindnera jadinii NRRL Y-1542]ODV74834.1 WD40 repeat-like protein [Cyberlindnera jadinii NRRL Y-1542]CEP21501.1 TAF5 [Cyberlindnera jadinii]
MSQNGTPSSQTNATGPSSSQGSAQTQTSAQQSHQNQQGQQGQPNQANAQARRQGNTFSPADLNRIVLEYLNKKGYLKTEAMLRVESSHVPTQPLPNVAGNASRQPVTDESSVANVEKLEPAVYVRGYSMLKAWVESSLDIYRPELFRVLYPLFVHAFLDLVRKDPSSARKFFDRFKSDHEILHGSEVSKLSAIGTAEHLEENELAKLYRDNSYVLHISRTALNLLLYFLHENEAVGGSVMISLINRYITPVITNESLANAGEGALDDGIKGLQKTDEVSKFNSQEVKLGKMPMDPEFAKEVETELQKKDEKSKGEELLVPEFLEMTKADSDSPSRDVLPLPQKSALDLKREIQAVRDSRDKIKLDTIQAAAPSVCMYTFHNTNNELTTLEFNEDSTMIAGGFQDSYIRLWSIDGSPLQSVLKSDKHNHENTRKLIGHSGSVYGLSFSPDNRYLLSCSEDKTTRLWSLDTYTALVSYKGHNHPIWDVKFSPLGHYFATASHDHTARLWSTDHIYPLRIFAGHLNDVDTVEFHPNSTYVFTGSADKTCRMWDVSRGNSVRIFNGHTGAVNAMAVSPDGRWLASAGEDSIINIWDIGSGRRLKTMRGHGRSSIYSLAFSQEGSILVSGAADNTVRVWDIKRNTNEAGPLPEPFPMNDDPTTSVNAGGKDKEDARRRKEIVATTDHLAAFFTKRSPVYKVHFTRGNLCLAAGIFRG